MSVTVDYDREFEVETDASDYCIAATAFQSHHRSKEYNLYV